MTFASAWLTTLAIDSRPASGADAAGQGIQPAGAASAASGAKAVGWRGNWTGRFPEAAPVTTWSVKPKSPAAGLRYQATQPAKDDAGANAKEVWAGDVAHWLVLSGFNAKDPKTALDEAFVPDEANLGPAEGDKAGGREWTLDAQEDYRDLFTPKNFRKHVWGPYYMGWQIRFYDLEGKGANTVGYAHAYLHAPSAGKVCMIVNHEDGMKAWVNGKEVYRNDKPFRNFSANANEVDISIRELTVPPPAPRFDAELQKGWNRLLIKIARKEGSGRFSLRITAPADAEYETANVRWVAPMPSWSWSTPIVVGDRVFLTSEPDELVCVSKADGKILWRRANTLYDATPEEERAKNPIFKEVEPLAAELAKGVDHDRGTALRRRMLDLLMKIDKVKYDWRHMAPHVAAIGNTVPTPCSDGRSVYAFLPPGVVVCYDLEGNRRWIQNVMDLGVALTKNGQRHEPTSNNCASPVLIGDKFILFKGWFRAFDTQTGKVAWDTGALSKDFDTTHGGVPRDFSSQSLVPLRLGGTDFLMGFWGRVLRASDGKVMCSPVYNEFAYSTPVIDGDIAYVWAGGKYKMTLKDDKVEMKGMGAIPGTYQYTISSPLLHDGLIYALDPYGVLNVADAQTLQPVYQQRLDLWPLLHNNAVGCTPSVALGGKHVYLMDNQGSCVVIEPGRTFKQVACNRIDTMMQHAWPLAARERIEATPVFDGKCLYIRGEKNLYCIGEK